MEGGVSRIDKMSHMRNHKLKLMQEKLRREQIYDRTPSPQLLRDNPTYHSEKGPEHPDPNEAYQSRSKSPQPRAYSRSKSNPKLVAEKSEGARSPTEGWAAAEEERDRLAVTPAINVDYSPGFSPSQVFNVPQLKFYENAIDQYNRKVQIECLVQEKIKYMANSKKMNDKSEMILREKIEESLMAAYHEVCPEEDSVVTFEKLGRILYCMGTFSIIQYDENAILVKNFEGLNRADRAQHYNEMMLHEQIWNHIAFTGEVIKDSGSNNYQALSFLKGLFEPKKLSVSDQTEFIASRNIFTKGMIEVAGLPSIREDCQILGENQKPTAVWGLKTLVKRFQELMRTKTFSARTGNLRAEKAEELQRKYVQDLTFAPKINEHSKILGQINDEKLKRSIVHTPQQRPASSTSSGVLNRVDILYQKHSQKEQNLEKKRLQAEEKLRQECTFKPNTNLTQKRGPKRLGSSQDVKNVVERLYETQTEKHEMLKKLNEQKQQKKELEELKKCTFFPQTNDIENLEDLRKLYSQKTLPKNFDKDVERLKVANEKKADLKKRLEHIPAGENYEKRRSEPFRPPTCAEVDRRDKPIRQPFMHFDISVGGGKSGRLALCEGDDPVDKARSFAAAFKLKPEMEENLRMLIQSNLEEYMQSQGHPVSGTPN